jgi:hypothetical protein
MISLSTVICLTSVQAEEIRQIDHYGVTVTQECWKKGEIKDCPLEQVQKISKNNPLMFIPARRFTEEGSFSQGEYFLGMLYHLDEAKIYILDLSEMEKHKLTSLEFRGNMLVSGRLLEDNITVKVKNIIHNPLPRSYWKGMP